MDIKHYIMLVVFSIASLAYSAQVRLAWDPPTNNVDGSALTNLAGYIVYYGTNSRVYTNRTDVSNVTTTLVSNLSTNKTYYFAVTAYATETNSQGTPIYTNESAYSEELAWTVPSGHTYEIFVDNVAAMTNGFWIAATTTAGYYNTNYIHDGNTNKGTKTATFTPYLQTSGAYSVYVWFTSYTNRASNVPIDIVSMNGTNTYYIDQRTNGSKWVLISTNNFAAGTNGYARIRTTGTTNGYVIADAFRFVSQSVFGTKISKPTNIKAGIIDSR